MNANRSRANARPTPTEREKRPYPALSPELGQAERSYVLNIARKFVHDEADAEDIAQDALLLAHRHRHSFRGDSRYSTWLYRVAATTALMHLRKTSRKHRELLDCQLSSEERSWLAEAREPAPTPERVVGQRQALCRVVETLAELAPAYRDILIARWFGGRTERALARELGLPLSTVKTRAHRGRHQVLGQCADLH